MDMVNKHPLLLLHMFDISYILKYGYGYYLWMYSIDRLLTSPSYYSFICDTYISKMGIIHYQYKFY